MPDTYVVIVDSLSVRSGPGNNYKRVGIANKGTKMIAYETNGVWIRHGTDKWSCIKGSASGGTIYYLSKEDNATKPVEVPPKSNPVKPTEPEDRSSGYLPNLRDFVMYQQDYAQQENLTIRNAMSILGLPYQFLQNADAPLKPSDPASLGRKYAEKIIAKSPLLLLTPGDPKFMTNYSGDAKKGILETILGKGNSDNADLKNILGDKGGRYYTFAFNYNEYYNFLNPMCRIAARLLGIQGETLDGVRLDRVDWMKFTAKRIESFTDIGLAGAIPFYIHSDTQISESFSNGTTESMLASKVNPMSDLSREINFLMGYGSNMLGKDISPLEQKDINENMQNVNDVINKLIGKSNMIKNLSGNIITVASGGKLIFPEIWSDSTFSRSYDINIKLTTPDCDKLSWYFNICVPVLHLVALVAPRGIDKNAAGYINPFLVRGYYKGLFNCDMGIITNMTINKGAEGAWTKEGLPTTVDVNFTLKDLYDIMSISNGVKGGIFSSDALKNTALMDYIANFCGININKPEVGRQLDIWFTQITNRIPDAIKKNIWGSIEQNMQNGIMNIYNTTLR